MTDMDAQVDVDLTLTPMCEFSEPEDGMHGDGEPASARYRHVCPSCGDVDSGLIGNQCIAWVVRERSRSGRDGFVIDCILCGHTTSYDHLTFTSL